MRIPAHAAIHETVAACRRLRKPWASGLVNAVLRGFADDLKSYQTDHSFELPEWIFSRLEARGPPYADEVMRGLLERAPMSLRVNTRRISVGGYHARLDSAGIRWNPGLIPEHIVLTQPRKAAVLPGYAAGLVSIQDGGAQLAASMLPLSKPGARILDACAAPGGKLFHLIETRPDVQFTALEHNERRFTHLVAEAGRLGHEGIELLCADATSRAWWSGEEFDAILADVPCSGVGTLRRHPDIKHLRVADDLPGFRTQQENLLARLWHTLRPGGNLLYCTCSLFDEENDQVISNFLASNRNAVTRPINFDQGLPTGLPTQFGWQLFPLPATQVSAACSVDGFFYALLEKRKT
jgi:16S rRNA (cytosine967-C5)-methyltransferase